MMMKRLMWTVSIPASCRPDGSHLRSDVRGRETERRASFPGKNHPSCYRTIRQMSHNVNGNSRGLGQTERRRSYWVRNSRLCSALLCSYCYETPQSTDVWPAETTALSKPTIQHNGLMRMREDCKQYKNDNKNTVSNITRRSFLLTNWKLQKDEGERLRTRGKSHVRRLCLHRAVIGWLFCQYD